MFPVPGASPISKNIHTTALIGDNVQIGSNVTIGPYTIIEDDVRIGSNTRIGNFNTICSGTTIGEDCNIYHNCSIGEKPQDLKYAGEKTLTEIGNRVLIRESVTINRGTIAHGVTQIGDDVLLMAYVHVAHDCLIGNQAIFANQVTLGGHVEVGEYASLGGGVLVHQFSKIGKHAFVGGGFRVVQDIPPYILTAGEPLKYHGINRIGLERNGFTQQERTTIKSIYRIIFRSGLNKSNIIKQIETEFDDSSYKTSILDFIKNSERGLI